jgi:hypothetical protein
MTCAEAANLATISSRYLESESESELEAVSIVFSERRDGAAFVANRAAQNKEGTREKSRA